MATGSYLTPIYSRSQSEVQGDHHTCLQDLYCVLSASTSLPERGAPSTSKLMDRKQTSKTLAYCQHIG
ncbi:hypothetical protein TNCV_2170051 [Trichonephila clavipes]|nr:hypothetical protein TNCV_2170051 [Trichonephila clavipes]